MLRVHFAIPRGARHATKVMKYAKTVGTVNTSFKPSLVQKHTRIRLYETLAGPIVYY
jgi:hypothetical protein